MAVGTLKTVWPEWEIDEKPLGKGSFGVVYKAVRREYNVESYAAIKVISIPADPSEIESLRSEGLDEEATKTYLRGVVDDFVAEIQMMETLKGVPNIVGVEDYKVIEKTEEIGWDIYIRMELLTPFNNYICDKKLTEEDVIKLGCDICTALEICGKRNIIHRDIKPENIFVNDFGFFKLGDFGIARKMENMTSGLSQKGTFNYMAPEVASSNKYDARVDTYSLGIVLYRLLNGNRLPFLDKEKQLLNPNERRNAVDRRIHGEELPAPCEASAAMADVILRACAFDPDKRFASATQMKQALISVANGTYKAAAPAGDMDATVSVRKAAVDYDKTVSVRKAPVNKKPTIADQKVTAPSQKQTVEEFGGASAKMKNVPLVAAILTTIFVAAVLLLLVLTLTDWFDTTPSKKETPTKEPTVVQTDALTKPKATETQTNIVKPKTNQTKPTETTQSKDTPEIALYKKADAAIADPITVWCYDDFDGNGTKEAFIITGDNSDIYADKTLWYINSAGKVQTLIEDCPNWMYREVDECGSYKLFYLSARHGTGDIFGVKNDEPVEIERPPYYSIGQDDETGVLIGANKRSQVEHILEFDPVTMSIVDTGRTVGNAVACTKIELSVRSIEFCKAGDTWMLICRTTPENVTEPVTFESSAPDVVTVDENGVLIAVSAGEATIYVSCGEATNACQVICNF